MSGLLTSLCPTSSSCSPEPGMALLRAAAPSSPMQLPRSRSTARPGSFSRAAASEAAPLGPIPLSLMSSRRRDDFVDRLSTSDWMPADTHNLC